MKLAKDQNLPEFSLTLIARTTQENYADVMRDEGWRRVELNK